MVCHTSPLHGSTKSYRPCLPLLSWIWPWMNPFPAKKDESFSLKFGWTILAPRRDAMVFSDPETNCSACIYNFTAWFQVSDFGSDAVTARNPPIATVWSDFSLVISFHTPVSLLHRDIAPLFTRTLDFASPKRWWRRCGKCKQEGRYPCSEASPWCACQAASSRPYDAFRSCISNECDGDVWTFSQMSPSKGSR